MNPAPFDAASSLRLIAESLSLLDRFGARPIRVRDIRMADETLVVQIDVASDDPVSVRGEIAGAMGALAGLDIPTLFPALRARTYGVRAFGPMGSEIMWIVSSPEAAGFAGNGNPVEWLANSLVQENTPSYRRSQADRRIGQVETTLRDLLDEHGESAAGEKYPAALWSSSELAGRRRQAMEEERDPSDPRVLLDYAFLPRLAADMTGHLSWFGDGCIPARAAFERDLSALNKVRRKVAHHREVTNADLEICESVAESVLGPIGLTHPDLAIDFLVDRWEARVSAIFAEAQRAFASAVVPAKGQVAESERRAATTRALEAQRAAIERAFGSLDAVVVPSPRVQLHRSALAGLERWRNALQVVALLAGKPGVTVAEAEYAKLEYDAALDEVGAMTRQIKAIRVGLPPEPDPSGQPD